MTIRTARPVLAAALFLAASVLGGCSEGESRMEKGFEDGFKTQFVDNFGKSCRSSAEGSAAPADKIEAICKCTADELVKKYSASELMSLSPETAAPVMKECAAKSGLAI
jgi:hypothetical protein